MHQVKKRQKVEVVEIPIGNGKVIALTPTKAIGIAAVIFALVLGPVGFGHVFVQKISTQAFETSASLDTQITELDNQIKQYEATDGEVHFDPIAEIEKVLKNNRTKIMAYAALGESIPKNLFTF